MVEILIKGPQGSGKTIIADLIDGFLRLAGKKICRFSSEGERYPYRGSKIDIVIKEESSDDIPVSPDGYLIDGGGE